MKTIFKGFLTGLFNTIVFSGYTLFIGFSIFVYTKISEQDLWNAVGSFVGATVILITTLFLISIHGFAISRRLEEDE